MRHEKSWSLHESTPVAGDPIHLYGLEDTVFEVYLHEPSPSTPLVPEALVQDLWQAQQFDPSGLQTSDGSPLTVLNPGTLNSDGGPDFRNARVRIAGQIWYGDIEIHLTSSAWLEHKHHLDSRYNSVILHVVLYEDAFTGTLRRANGSPLTELALSRRLSAPLRTLLHRFYTGTSNDVPCADQWTEIPVHLTLEWVEKLALERLQAKTHQVAAAYLHRPDVETLLYELLMTGLGYAKNAAPMLSLARRIPLTIARSVVDALDLEALYLGIAGLLPAPLDLLQADRETSDYSMELRNRYERLRLTFDVSPVPRESWQFFRLRPFNFPPLRIAQAVALLREDPPGLLRQDPLGRLEAALLSPSPVEALRRLLMVEPSPFWRTHVRLDRASQPHSATIGKRRTDELIVNAIVPVILLQADQTTQPALEASVLGILRRLPAERDEITGRFEHLGKKPASAFHTQGLHQLYRTRCQEARCLTCAIGQHILNR